MSTLIRYIADSRARRSVTRTLLVLLALGAVWMGVNASNLWELSRAARDRWNKRQRLLVARRAVEDLEHQRELLKTSHFESEKRLRKEMMLRPGERIILLEWDDKR